MPVTQAIVKSSRFNSMGGFVPVSEIPFLTGFVTSCGVVGIKYRDHAIILTENDTRMNSWDEEEFRHVRAKPIDVRVNWKYSL